MVDMLPGALLDGVVAVMPTYPAVLPVFVLLDMMRTWSEMRVWVRLSTLLLVYTARSGLLVPCPTSSAFAAAFTLDATVAADTIISATLSSTVSLLTVGGIWLLPLLLVLSRGRG